MRILVHVCCAPCFTSVHETLKTAGHDVVAYFFNPNIQPYQEFKRRLHCLERYSALKPVEIIYNKEYDLDRYLIAALKAKYDTAPKLFKDFIESRKKKSTAPDGFSERIEMRDQLQIKLIPRSGDGIEDTIVDVNVEETTTTQIDGSISIEKTIDPDLNPRCGFCIQLRLAKTANLAKEQGFDAFTTTLLESKYQPHEYIKFIGEHLGKEIGVKFFYQDFRMGWKESIRISKELELYRQPYCGCIFSEYERFGP